MTDIDLLDTLTGDRKKIFLEMRQLLASDLIQLHDESYKEGAEAIMEHLQMTLLILEAVELRNDIRNRPAVKATDSALS